MAVVKLTNEQVRLVTKAIVAEANNQSEPNAEFEILLDKLVEMCEKRRMWAELEAVQEVIKARKRMVPVIPFRPLLISGGDAA